MAATKTSSPSHSPSSTGTSNGTSAMSAPPPPPTSASKIRKKPGPKPKAKPAKPSLVLKLKLRPSLLATIGRSPLASTSETVNGEVTTSNTPNGNSPTGSSPKPSSPGANSEAAAPTAAAAKRRGVPGPKPGTKRGRVPGAPPGKPGRKKTKLDPSAPGALAGGLSKLGPKASMGAINDKLRALDRSGAPCKRWQKAGFTLKSFTGVQWAIPTWARPVNTTTITPDENGVSSTLETPENASTEPPSVAAASPVDNNPDRMEIDSAPPAEPAQMPSLPQGITA